MRSLRTPLLSLLMCTAPLACSGESSSSASGASASTSSTSTTGTTSTTTSSGGDGGEGGMGQGGANTGVGGQGGTQGTGGSGGQGGEQGTGGGQGGSDACNGSPVAEITTPGSANVLLLQGMVVTPDQAFAGEVLVVDDLIACVAATCSGSPSAQGATVIDTHGIIMPGMIDTHNHIQFDIFDEDDWSPKKAYDNHNQWTSEDQYTAMVDVKQCLNGEAVCPSDLPKQDLGCELVKYGEIKGLIAGTTAIVGAASPANKTCYESVVRTIDQGPNDLASDKVQVATLEPSSSNTLNAVCNNIQSSKTDAYLPHIGEGKPGNATALGEFAKLHDLTSDPTPGVGCLYTDETAIVHGSSFGDTEFVTMASHLMDLVWSPRSNVFLYGAGSDFNQTTDVGTALSYGINVALGCDWSMGGSPNLLEEMRFADTVDEARWQTLSKHDLIDMTTKNAAKVLALDAQLGSLEVGKKADITVIFGDVQNPYDAIFAATPREVRLVLIDGIPRYGDIELMSLGPAVPGCETIDICCRSKFMCIAETGNTQGIGETFVQIQQALSDGLGLVDATGKTYGSPPVHYDFLPLTPIVKCDP